MTGDAATVSLAAVFARLDALAVPANTIPDQMIAARNRQIIARTQQDGWVPAPDPATLTWTGRGQDD
jgi:hypothetical protein